MRLQHRNTGHEEKMDEKTEIEDFAPWFLIFITLAGFLLRGFLLGKNGMWLDEAFSVWVAKHSIPDMLYWIVRIDQHPPLYYFLLHYWIKLNGDSPSAVRMLSVLFGTATIPIVYLIGKRLSGVLVGMAASAFFALSPFNILFAQDARMYTLLAFNASVAIYALVSLLTDPRSARSIGSQFREYLHVWRTQKPIEPESQGEFSYKDGLPKPTGLRAWISRHRWLPIQTVETDLAWVAFIVFSEATIYTHNTAILFPLATNIFVLGLLLFQRTQKNKPAPTFQAPALWNWVKSQIGIFILWIPWMIPFYQQASRVYQEFWISSPTWNSVVQVLESFLDENILRQAPPEVIGKAGLVVTGQGSQATTIIWFLYALVLCLGLVFFWKKFSQFLFLAALFLVPFLGELIISIRRPIFLDRTLIWITIPLFLLLAAGIARLKFRILILVVLVTLSINNLLSDSDYYRFYRTEDWISAAREVAAFDEKNDLVLFNASWVQIPFDYYYGTFNLRLIKIDEHGVPADMFDRGILEPKMTDSDLPRLISLLQGHKRVWLVYSHNSYTDPMGLIPQALANRMQLIKQDDYFGVQVQLFETP